MSDFPMQFKDCYAMTQLPYFKLDENGKPALDIPDAPPIVDFHTHLGFFFLFASPINYQAKTPSVKHNFPMRRGAVDLSIYSGVNLTQIRRNGMFADHGRSIFTNKGPNATFTVPNILDEMNRFNVSKAVVLAIDFAVGSNLSETYIDATQGNERLINFCGINPFWPDIEEKVEKFVELGARGLKVHPYAHLAGPDHPKVIRLLEAWDKTGLPVLFHTAFNGLEPGPLRKLAGMDRYEKALSMFPGTTFILGHAGMNDYNIALDYADRFENVYLEIGGHPPHHIQDMIERIGYERLLYGTDWPFYPFILPLAKVLMATDGEKEARNAILSGNGLKLIEQAEAAVK
ncbi:MAG TPA: amidohydrolase family protein [bacterium]|nr:amidohydrolase family protein [bacterium]